MSSSPIKSPVGGRSFLSLLQQEAPDIYRDLQNVKHDSPRDYKSSNERRKKPYEPNDPLDRTSR